MKAYSHDVKIPKERIAVLIGKNGEVKKKIEEELNCKLKIDSETGLVRIVGEDAVKLYKAREIVIAISRGFSPENAFLLLKTDYSLEIINLRDFARSNNRIKRIKGRIIGSEGKAKKTIENFTNTLLSIYGKTVSIIGSAEDVPLARRAILMLVSGSPHTRVYNLLARMVREEKTLRMLAYQKILGNEENETVEDNSKREVKENANNKK